MQRGSNSDLKIIRIQGGNDLALSALWCLLDTRDAYNSSSGIVLPRCRVIFPFFKLEESRKALEGTRNLGAFHGFHLLQERLFNYYGGINDYH